MLTRVEWGVRLRGLSCCDVKVGGGGIGSVGDSQRSQAGRDGGDRHCQQMYDTHTHTDSHTAITAAATTRAVLCSVSLPDWLSLCCCVGGVGIAGFPTLLFLSRGRLWEYQGSRSRADLVDFATQKQRRGRTAPPASEGNGQEEVEVDGLTELRSVGSVDGEEDEGVAGRPIPPVPSTWDVVVAAVVQWSARLTHVLLEQSTVAAALLLMGALIGVLLSTVVFTLTLDSRIAPPPYASIPKLSSTGTREGTEAVNHNNNKAVKGE